MAGWEVRVLQDNFPFLAKGEPQDTPLLPAFPTFEVSDFESPRTHVTTSVGKSKPSIG